MRPPQLCTAKLTDKIVFNPRFVQYTFEYVLPPAIEFDAGQYVSIQVSEHGDRRSYSIASSPEKTHGFDLLVDLAPQGLGSRYLEALQLGQEVKLLAPMGVFTLATNPEEESLAFVATGSGIAPFRSMVLDQLQLKGDQRQMTIYWGMRRVEDLFWMEEWEMLAESFPNFHFHPVISQALPEWTLCRGRVTDCLKIHQLPEKAGYYLCGNQPMINDVTQLLQLAGIGAAHIHHEKFY